MQVPTILNSLVAFLDSMHLCMIGIYEHGVILADRESGSSMRWTWADLYDEMIRRGYPVMLRLPPVPNP